MSGPASYVYSGYIDSNSLKAMRSTAHTSFLEADEAKA